MQGSRRVREVTLNHINPKGPKLTTHSNPVLQTVPEEIQKGDWHLASKRLSIDTADFSLLEKMKDVFPLNTSGNFIIRRSRVVVPKTLQRQAVELAREGHQGFEKPSRCYEGRFSFRASTSG